MGDVFRTPDERFDGLPDFPFEPHYREVDGLRLAHLDEGEGRPVVFFHGEPTWSYLWRKVIPPVRDAGYRCIAPDYAGFGRSDKPTDFDWYSYDRHTELAATLLADLDLRDATVVVHDWGGPIGLRLRGRASRPDLADRDHGHRACSPASSRWARPGSRSAISSSAPRTCRSRCWSETPAPAAWRMRWRPPTTPRFPTPESKAGARAFPLILPTSPEMPGAAAGKRALEALRGDGRPTLVLWADSDPVLPFKVGEAFAAADRRRRAPSDRQRRPTSSRRTPGRRSAA